MTDRPTTPEATMLEATSTLNASRERAREAAWPVIQAMLGALHQAMAGVRLRGMANLATSTNPYRALHVRAKRVDKGLPFPRVRGGSAWGPEVMVLTEDGALQWARRSDDGDVNERSIEATEVRAEDVEHLAETISEACARHMAASEKATAQYDDMLALAERLRAALEER